MKEAELRNHCTCDACGRKVLATGLPLFWRVTVERFGVDLQAARRQDGLAAFLGSSSLAAVMGPDEDIAKPLMGPVKLTLCESCAMEPNQVAAIAMEKAAAQERAQASEERTQ